MVSDESVEESEVGREERVEDDPDKEFAMMTEGRTWFSSMSSDSGEESPDSRVLGKVGGGEGGGLSRGERRGGCEEWF